jgi:hypothetical protein
VSANLKKHLQNLTYIYLAKTLVVNILSLIVQDNASGVLLNGFITGKQYMHIKEHLLERIAEIRPQLLNLVEGFGFTDNALCSALGSSDGKCYE